MLSVTRKEIQLGNALILGQRLVAYEKPVQYGDIYHILLMSGGVLFLQDPYKSFVSVTQQGGTPNYMVSRFGERLIRVVVTKICARMYLTRLGDFILFDAYPWFGRLGFQPLVCKPFIWVVSTVFSCTMDSRQRAFKQAADWSFRHAPTVCTSRDLDIGRSVLQTIPFADECVHVQGCSSCMLQVKCRAVYHDRDYSLFCTLQCLVNEMQRYLCHPNHQSTVLW